MTLDLLYAPVSIGKFRLWLIFASTLDNMGALGKVSSFYSVLGKVSPLVVCNVVLDRTCRQGMHVT